MNYECHITLPLAERELAERVSAEHPQWKFSAIDGDPVLGKKAFCYLTAHDTDIQPMLARMQSAEQHVRDLGGTVLRAKIELIIYDKRYAV